MKQAHNIYTAATLCIVLLGTMFAFHLRRDELQNSFSKLEVQSKASALKLWLDDFKTNSFYPLHDQEVLSGISNSPAIAASTTLLVEALRNVRIRLRDPIVPRQSNQMIKLTAIAPSTFHLTNFVVTTNSGESRLKFDALAHAASRICRAAIITTLIDGYNSANAVTNSEAPLLVTGVVESEYFRKSPIILEVTGTNILQWRVAFDASLSYSNKQ